MAAETTSTLDGFFKDRYVDKLKDLIPKWSVFQGLVGFDSQNKIGNEYVMAVLLSRPHGFTYSSGGTAYTLNAAVPLQTRDARVGSNSFVLREEIAYDVISRARGSEQAFAAAFDPIAMAMLESANLYLELPLLYGGRHIGATEATDDSGGTTAEWTISKATWADGIWAQMEGAPIDVYDDPADGGNKRNSNADITITSVDAANRKITVSGNSTDLSDIDSNITDSFIKPKGADSNWFTGLRSIISHTSGSLFGINATNHTQWRGNSYANGSVKATFATFNKAACQTLGRGGMGDRIALVSHWTWADINNDSAEFRRDVNKKGGDFSLGVDSIEYMAPTGKVKIVMHPMVHAGEAYLIDPKCFKRIGSSDFTWKLPNSGEDRFLVQSADSASFQIRCYWDQALFSYDLTKHCLITGIVNNSL